jgi:hypothetical protein
LLSPLSSWLAEDSAALRLSTFNATKDMVRVRAGGDNHFATGLIYPLAVPVRGTAILQEAAIFKAPMLGENIDLKVYYTNPAKNIFRRFLELCRMNNFAVGTVNNCTFPLPTINGVNAGALEDPFFLEMELNTPVTYKSRPGLGATGFGGTAITTPANKLAPNCPMPDDPRGVVNISNPLPPLLGLDPLDPNIIYLSPSGDSFGIPASLPKIRLIDL